MKRQQAKEPELVSLLLGIKKLVLLFDEVEREKPSEKKARKMLRIYSSVVTKLLKASDIVQSKSEIVSPKQVTIVKMLVKEIPEFHDLVALFLALSDKTQEELNNLDVAVDVKAQLKPLIGNKTAIAQKEAELKKKLSNIVTALQIMV